MINSSFTLGPFTIPLKLILFIGAAATAHLIFYLLNKKDREVFKKVSDIFFNTLILFVLGWRLSLILTNWSTFKEAPTALIYLPGGILNHLAGAVLVLLSILIFYKRQKYSLKDVLDWCILTAGTLGFYFVLTVSISFIPLESQLPEIVVSTVENKESSGLSLDSDIILLTMEGEEQTLLLTGSPVTIVNFWASWCPPCRAEIPEIDRFYSEYKDQDIRLITVNMTTTEKSIETAVKFIEEKEADFPVLLDHKGEAAAYFQINSVPSTYVFNSRGELIAQKTGAVDYVWLKNVSKASDRD